VIWLKADSGTTRATGDFMRSWLDQSGHENHATTRLITEQQRPPLLITNGWNGQPVTRWTNLSAVYLPDLSSLSEGEAFIALRTGSNFTIFPIGIWQMGGGQTAYPAPIGSCHSSYLSGQRNMNFSPPTEQHFLVALSLCCSAPSFCWAGGREDYSSSST
jgi:hypothetical protein